MPARVPVTFAPSGVTAWVAPGTSLLEAARLASVVVPAACGGRGVCGSCAVRIEQGGLSAPEDQELALLRRAPNGVRLACRARVTESVTVRPLGGISEAEVIAADGFAEKGETALVAGVDLGTTNIAMSVLAEQGGRELGSAVVANPQQVWGADVLSRISAAVAGDGQALTDSVRRSIGQTLLRLSGAERLRRVVVAGNTAMTALLAGADVTSLAAHPFRLPEVPVQAPEGVFAEAPADEVLLVPPLAGFVGGDVLAGLVHTGTLYAGRPEMFVDLGTNAEIVLVSGGRLWAASAAAGPAFEGVGIESGGPVRDGSVVSLSMVGDRVLSETVGEASPEAFTGSGLVSALAMLREVGHLDREGLVGAQGPLAARMKRGEDQVLRVDLGDPDAPLLLSQLDVRSLQLAKAAVRVGVEFVLRAAGVSAAEVARVHVAGAFGDALNIADLVALGVLPVSFSEVSQSVGNASLGGAMALAFDPELLEDARERARAVQHVDLAADPAFNERLMRALELAPYEI